MDAIYGGHYWELRNDFSSLVFFNYRICYNGEISLQTSFLVIVEKLVCLISTIAKLKFNLGSVWLGKKYEI